MNDTGTDSASLPNDLRDLTLRVLDRQLAIYRQINRELLELQQLTNAQFTLLKAPTTAAEPTPTPGKSP